MVIAMDAESIAPVSRSIGRYRHSIAWLRVVFLFIFIIQIRLAIGVFWWGD